MSVMPQKRALKNYRKRLNRRGMARFEVLGLDAGRELIRSLKAARRRWPRYGTDLSQVRRTILGSHRKRAVFVKMESFRARGVGICQLRERDFLPASFPGGSFSGAPRWRHMHCDA